LRSVPTANDGSPSYCTRPRLRRRAAGAQLGHEVERVRDEQDRLAGLLELRDLGQALAREGLVTDGEHLVHEQDVRVDVHAMEKASFTYSPEL
jgi:hypothetical protein